MNEFFQKIIKSIVLLRVLFFLMEVAFYCFGPEMAPEARQLDDIYGFDYGKSLFSMPVASLALILYFIIMPIVLWKRNTLCIYLIFVFYAWDAFETINSEYVIIHSYINYLDELIRLLDAAGCILIYMHKKFIISENQSK